MPIGSELKIPSANQVDTKKNNESANSKSEVVIKKYADKEYPIILEMKNNENMIQIDFENQKNTKKEYVKGTGIGIQNIKNMMEQMKGESEIINNENRYAIVLSFPIYIE